MIARLLLVTLSLQFVLAAWVERASAAAPQCDREAAQSLEEVADQVEEALEQTGGKAAWKFSQEDGRPISFEELRTRGASTVLMKTSEGIELKVESSERDGVMKNVLYVKDGTEWVHLKTTSLKANDSPARIQLELARREGQARISKVWRETKPGLQILGLIAIATGSMTFAVHSHNNFWQTAAGILLVACVARGMRIIDQLVGRPR